MILRIRNWGKYQHYKDRCPPWIKLHFQLLSSRDWVALADASRVLAVACMLVASQSDGEPGEFEADPAYLKRVAYLNSEPDFKPLINCGFLEVVDGVLADASGCKRMQAKATTEAYKATETETENTCTADAGAGQEATKAENCPQQQIIAIYHELLPELPPVHEWPDAGAAQLRARWRSAPERQSLDWWRNFFSYVKESDFLMGRKADFQASLGWLVKASNFAKVVNGNYENRSRP